MQTTVDSWVICVTIQYHSDVETEDHVNESKLVVIIVNGTLTGSIRIPMELFIYVYHNQISSTLHYIV